MANFLPPFVVTHDPIPSVLLQQPRHVSVCPWPSFAPPLPFSPSSSPSSSPISSLPPAGQRGLSWQPQRPPTHAAFLIVPADLASFLSSFFYSPSHRPLQLLLSAAQWKASARDPCRPLQQLVAMSVCTQPPAQPLVRRWPGRRLPLHVASSSSSCIFESGTIFDARTRLLLVCADLLSVCAHCPLLASWRALPRDHREAQAREKNVKIESGPQTSFRVPRCGACAP